MVIAVSAAAGNRAGDRFRFGANWQRFLHSVNEPRIEAAVSSLLEMLRMDDLVGRRFLDAGSGSGLFSLAARTLGAEVTSFDYDVGSVECTREVKRRYCPDDKEWSIHQGSVLDVGFLSTLGTFDVVYSWGVLHHTGDLFKAMHNMADLVRASGQLFLSIYNDQGRATRRWTWVKSRYNASGHLGKALLLMGSAVRLEALPVARALMAKRDRTTSRDRSMAWWIDLVDWVGGWPFEAAKPEAIFDFYRQRGFELDRLKTCGGGLGCNEFVFVKTGSSPVR